MGARQLDETFTRQLVQDVDNFIFDCDGVLWDGNGAVPGSLEAVKLLQKLGKKIFYATNNSSKTRAQYAEKCKTFGYTATEDDIACTAVIAALYLKSINFKGKVYVVGNPAMGTELENCGIEHIGIGPDPQENSPEPVPLEVLNSKLDPEVNCVLVGFDKHISYPKLVKAASYLKRKDCLFVGTNEDCNLPVTGDIVVPGTGTMVGAVKVPSRREPIIVGKPGRTMFDVLQKTHNLDPERCCFVGDTIVTDIGIAKTCGLKSLLVFTGVNQLEDVKPETSKFKPEQMPDYYTSCFGDITKLLSGEQS